MYEINICTLKSMVKKHVSMERGIKKYYVDIKMYTLKFYCLCKK